MADRKLSYIHEPESFEFDYVTIPERLCFLAEKYGDKEVYTFLHPDGKRDTITAKEVYNRSRALAASLMKLGIGSGDIVATCVHNDLDVLLATFGVICTGAVISNILIRNEDGSDLVKKAKLLDIKCIIVNPGKDNKSFKACKSFLDEINGDGSVKSKRLPSLKTFISTDPVEGYSLLILKDLYGDPGENFQLPRLDPESTVVLLPTSGSTGESKFVPHTHHDTMIISNHLKKDINFNSDDIIYNERRISWIGGFPYMFLLNAVKVVTKTLPFPSLTEHCDFTYKTIIDEKCTHACLFPQTIIGLQETIAKLHDKPRFLLKNIHTGALPIASVCMEAIGLFTEMVTVSYGSSEAGFLTYNAIRKKEDYINYSSGWPQAGVEIKVVNDNGRVVERGVHGLIYARSPCLIWSYYKNEGKTKEVITPNHWINTDDVGYMMDDGQLVVAGRKSDIILQNGRNMFPSVIEAVVKRHPDVLDVLVISVPDESMFEKVCACVIPLPGRSLKPEDVAKFYSDGVLPFQNEAFCTDSIEAVLILDKFPSLYTGKPDKVALKELAKKKINKM